ncbi:MAG: PEGA domain-containing protein, partial [Spirochaetaceae bacterium]|nr:PEGA domain-containing protein [Spirochaetaceae bacterium]
MSEEKKITQENIDNAEVHLHPFLGVSPRKYLPALYGLLLALILFLLLFLPGINNYGSLLVFSGAPAECAVYVDNAFKGDTDQRLFLKAGSYSLRIEHQGFQTEEMKVTIGGRLFGSLFSKKKAKVDYSLKPDKPIEFLDAAFGEFSTWSLSGTPSALYQFPMVLSSAASDLASTSTLQDGGVFGAGADDKPEMAFMRDILSMTVSPVAARDGLRA